MPTVQDIRIVKALKKISVGYSNGNYIAEKVLPKVDVTGSTGTYYKWGRESFSLENDKRAPGREANRISQSVSHNDQYLLLEHSLSTDIPKEDIREGDIQGLKIKTKKTKTLKDKLLLRQEYTVAQKLFNVSSFPGMTSALGATAKWDVVATSTPLEDVEKARQAILKQTGILPNIMVIGGEVWSKLKRHPSLLNAVNGGATTSNIAMISLEVAASLFELEEIIVGNTVVNAGAEGEAFSGGFVWGKYALIAYRAKQPDVDSPSLGYILSDPAMEDVKTGKDERAKSEWVDVSTYYTVEITSAISGYLYSAVVS